jgi:drug/metabolite transporter (DMT)-like permease
MPALFVLLWASGFIGAKYGLPAAPPASFLLVRFTLVVAILMPIALLAHARWPAQPAQWGHLAVAGLLVQGGYLGGVFHAIDRGMSAGLSALIVGLQPLLTALLASFMLGERVTRIQWAGLVLGLGGAGLVVEDKISVAGLTWQSLLFAIVALFSMTVGTVYQKRYCGMFDLRTGAIIQFIAAGLLMLPFAMMETRPVVWSPELIAAMTWLVLALSIVAIGLLALLVRRGAATKVASLFYLVPPCTALFAFAVFRERLSAPAVLGMALAVIGVAMVVRT